MSYGPLAEVYDWLVPEELLTPEGSADAFAVVIDELAPGARVLDCAAGTGPLAVGLALRGFDVTASDASPAMVARTRRLAADRGAELPVVECTWEELADQGWEERFDAVLCVGNSLPHAVGQAGRRAALAAMAGVLRRGGLLAVTSRNWELERAHGSGLQVSEQLVERDGRSGLVVHGWTIPEDWDDAHQLDIAVALVAADGSVTSRGERLTVWPFRHETLDADLRAAGLEPTGSTYDAAAPRYLVTARR
jgi:SAM-dependent methyltransferase